MNTVQTHAAPDLLSFDKVDIQPAEQPEGARDVARLGSVAVPIVPLSDTTLAITRSDLRAILKESYKLGWNGKALHQRQLIEKLSEGIGT